MTKRHHTNLRINQIMKKVSLFAKCLTVLVTIAELSGCSTVHAVDEDYSAEFLGSYRVADRSSERLLPIERIRVANSSTGIKLAYQTSSGITTRLATCHSTLGQWDRAVRSSIPDKSYHGYDCRDQYGTRWQFVHASVGSSSITPIFSKLVIRDVTSNSGYILFMASPGMTILHYALDPEPQADQK
ncbi:hypothetical protein G3O06_20905 [Burkholderia sp. Ac-20345]|uniref:hypothetical protein n=1 Tax=Burkholderia sp. Ac-20345 TaxID=2703891 RepID=UPI00197C5396|nr:hypothetical protein [Burkholderia sp. Ac-20345]MBN3779997.1 hypothetical protein [Burkholderia sp. Ac-20345]